MPDILQTAVDGFVKLLWPMVSALAAVGILSMALIEAWKSVLRPRRQFQKKEFEDWVRLRAIRTGTDGDTALKQLVMLATAGNEDALYELPVEKFTGQLNAAMQVVLAYPQKYAGVVQVIGCGADAADLARLTGPEPASDDAAAQRDHAAARTRVVSVAQRSLDAIQIDLGNRWARRLHFTSVALSSALILIAALWSVNLEVTRFSSRDVLGWIVIAIVGGMVAPVARDLVTALQRVRDRPR